ncbi:MAG: hypothetical protein JWQ11_1266 [Rhizobacter sp.]|nr:hypothetical protein [Rhizobacter sp.]
MSQAVQRAGAVLAGIWIGVLLAIAGIATPALFALLEPGQAGKVAGRVLAIEAYVSLAMCVVLFGIERSKARSVVAEGSGSVMTTNILLVLGALFCTVAGYFAVVPMMDAARAGQGRLSFGALHGISSGFYLLKMILVLCLAWRTAGARK